MPAHDGILLATKRVQERFTCTGRTSRLQTHGLLPEDSDSSLDNRQNLHSTGSQFNLQDFQGISSSQEAHGPHQIMDLSRLEKLDSQTASPHRSKPVRTTASSHHLSGLGAYGISAPTSPLPTSSASSPSKRQLAAPDEAEEDGDGVFLNPISRTTHAEAFSTLDSFAIDQIKNEQVPAPATKLSHGKWIQRIIGRPSGSMLRALSSSLAPINPPWMTLVPRSIQEEQDSSILGLRSSFEDVAHVPSTRSTGGARTNRTENKDILTQVPDDSFYMLLPLWPHETDPASAARERRQRPERSLDKEQNLYLLVYYVPFDTRREANAIKKRSRPRKGDRKAHYTTPLDPRRGFKIIGRLIAHSDLDGLSVRLPVRGLSVTGSLAEAEQGIPPASLRDAHSDDFVIGACLDRSDIEFIPEGLERLGLCVPRSGPLQPQLHPAMQTVEPSEEEGVPQPLTAIGRAAVEVVWLGCMALTTFYGPQSGDQRT